VIFSQVLTTPTSEDQAAPVDQLSDLNRLQRGDAHAVFLEFAGSGRWAQAMASNRPYEDLERLLEAAEDAFDDLGDRDWREAFAVHAPIGVPDPEDDRGAGEQSAMRDATPSERAEMAAGNERYHARFGHVFLIRAAGRSVREMLAALHTRLENDVEAELSIAAREQREITRLRLRDRFGG
jgi:OHCU decarboxylase